MDSELMLYLGRYYYICKAVVTGHEGVDDLRKYLIEAMGKPATSTRRHIEEIIKKRGCFL